MLPQGELVRRAAAWLTAERASRPDRALHLLLDEAGMRYNLSPVEQRMLADVFSSAQPTNGAPTGRPD